MFLECSLNVPREVVQQLMECGLVVLTSLHGLIFAEAFSENASLRLRQTILDALIDPYAAGPNVRLFEIPYEESIADDPEREIDRWISRICQATGTDIDALAFEYQKRVNALAKEIAWG